MVDQTKSNILIQKLLDHAELLYANPLLWYHNWLHVSAVQQTYKRLYGVSCCVVDLAIAYHDCVYIPGAPSGINEDLSAQTLRNAYTHYSKQLGVTLEREINQAGEIIDCTKLKYHLSDEALNERIFSDENIRNLTARVLDCDLCAFAYPEYLFIENQDNVIYEIVGEVQNADLISARRISAAFLNQFLLRKTIYRTPEAIEQLEATARGNIQRWVTKYSNYV